ncbi:MAG TPA: CDP-glycerol glycerophosphotransferase family protein, partial [Actinomycetaceae bacterium]|nr:CDP-glycerol glycerophosphotransferase family protein [Actinomycetaceae bacterium]
MLAAARWHAGLLRADLRYAARGAGGRRMRALRLLRLVTAPLFWGRDIWLVGERADSAADNGLHLFRYLRVHEPRRRAYYVIDAASPSFSLVRRLGHTVAHSSLRHEFLMLHASVMAHAHSAHHMLPRHWDRQAYTTRLAWRIGALQVFLQHGVHLSPNAVNRGSSGYDVFLTSARRESEALREVSGYDAQLAEVGLPRFDALRPTPPSRLILFKATWRRYLPSRVFGTRPEHDAFAGSAYERFFTDLLHSRRLQELLEAHNYRFVFVPHYNVAPFFTAAATASDRITVAAAGGTDLQALIRRSDVFMTDHSSVHFDAAYLGTPVIYARFDRDEYESRHAAPSW